MDPINSDFVVEAYLQAANEELAELFTEKGTLMVQVLAMRIPLEEPWDSVIRNEIENMAEQAEELEDKDKPKRRRKLVVILETEGGFVETVERIVTVFRKHYDLVDFIVPNFAYSSGTILVLSGDEIYMDYFSVLGPIDPQIQTDTGLEPALGYLVKYKELLSEINNPSRTSEARGELAYLIAKFQPTTIFRLSESINHGRDLIKNWLATYKFKDWTYSETHKCEVTKEMRGKRAEEVAAELGNVEKWHSHGRGISIRDLTGPDILLKIKNFGEDADLKNAIQNYHGVLIDFMGKRSIRDAIHSVRGLRRG